MFVVECCESGRLVEYRLFKSLENANKFLIWKAKDVGSTDLNLEEGKGHWWRRMEVQPE